MSEFRPNCRIWWPALKSGGSIITVESNRAKVLLDSGDVQTVALSAGVLERDRFEDGEQVEDGVGRTGIISGSGPSTRFPDYEVLWADGTTSVAMEASLRRREIRDPLDRIRAGLLSSAKDFNLRSAAADMWARNQSEELVSLAHARVDLQPHQVSVAHRVMSKFPHRFLLCDEVGLGKTIEAAMILKELRARSSARRVLILVPANLQIQWLYELKVKFNEDFQIFNRDKLNSYRDQNIANPWAEVNSVITSHSFASYDDERMRQIAAVPWDLIIVDEAHHARRQQQGRRQQSTRLYRLVRELTANPDFNERAVLFLTATPMQLHPFELFSLVELLDHTLFASDAQFEAHLRRRKGVSATAEALDRALNTTPTNPGASLPGGWYQAAADVLTTSRGELEQRLLEPEKLVDDIRSQHRLSEVMLRNRRAVVGNFMPRRAFRWEVQLTDRELRIHDEMENIIREGLAVQAATQRNAVGFLMVIWQKLLASSSFALRRSLERRCDRLSSSEHIAEKSLEYFEELEEEGAEFDEIQDYVQAALEDEVGRLQEIIDQLGHIDVDSKAQVLLDQLVELFQQEPNGKVLLFTEFRDTQTMLVELIEQAGWEAFAFHGQLSVSERDAAINRFRTSTRPSILVSTEAGGEGRNLQFAHTLVNYDLPWNPMRVEQRIGRIDRFGQEHTVRVFNFHVQDSIEGRILEVLDKRIGLFEESVGGLEPILGEVEQDIRKALRLSAEARDQALEEIGAKHEAQVRRGRQAERQMEDFVLDDRSYSRGIQELISRVERSSLEQEAVERMLTGILASAGTYISRPQQDGHRDIQFHPPFTQEERELIDGKEQRKVCFDPRVGVDSVSIEYMGFGHPIIDRLVHRVTSDSVEGAAAVRNVSWHALPHVVPGWQFNWWLKAGGRQPHERVVSIFVGDDGQVDLEVGRQLLDRSCDLDQREEPYRDIDLYLQSVLPTLPSAIVAAQQTIDGERDQEWAELSQAAEARHSTELQRVTSLYSYKREGAQSRHDADQRTLARLRASTDEGDRRVIPIWEGNVRLSQAVLQQLDADEAKERQQVNAQLNPDVSYSLLNVARINPM